MEDDTVLFTAAERLRLFVKAMREAGASDERIFVVGVSSGFSDADLLSQLGKA